MELIGGELPGQTPLDLEEADGLLIKNVTTREQLDQLEQQNIEYAIEWTISRRFKLEYLLSEEFVKDLHRKMFGNTWSWAGTFRRTDKNIGVAWLRVSLELRQLLGDVTYWYENDVFSGDELIIRAKHRLVLIHCFPNGNGRHSRLFADVLAVSLAKQQYFTWGRNRPLSKKTSRMAYLSALKAADVGDIQPLIEFSRS